MWHCLYAYYIVGGNDYGLSKLVPYVVISLYRVPFSLVLFFVVYAPMERVTLLGRNHHFLESKFPRNYQ